VKDNAKMKRNAAYDSSINRIDLLFHCSHLDMNQISNVDQVLLMCVFSDLSYFFVQRRKNNNSNNNTRKERRRRRKETTLLLFE
jgi:hypothetical protein